VVLIKKYASGCTHTDLGGRLMASGIGTLVIAGFSTGSCNRATAVDAIHMSFRAKVIQDAVAPERSARGVTRANIALTSQLSEEKEAAIGRARSR